MNALFDVDPEALNTPPSSPKASHPVYSDFSHIAAAQGGKLINLLSSDKYVLELIFT
jgi:hypothetical protein